MSRNYAALPHDYLKEMETLTDAEFGRLCRALLKYSSTGEMEELNGNERIVLPRVRMQEDRFQASYADLSDIRSEAGKKGAGKRWQGMASDSKAWQNIANDGKCHFANGKNGNTETNTNTEVKERDANASPKKSADKPRRFSPPSVSEVREYIQRKGYHVDAEAFVAFYESKGWMIGKNRMANWCQAVATWEKRWKEEHGGRDQCDSAESESAAEHHVGNWL